MSREIRQLEEGANVGFCEVWVEPQKDNMWAGLGWRKTLLVKASFRVAVVLSIILELIWTLTIAPVMTTLVVCLGCIMTLKPLCAHII